MAAINRLASHCLRFNLPLSSLALPSLSADCAAVNTALATPSRANNRNAAVRFGCVQQHYSTTKKSINSTVILVSPLFAGHQGQGQFGFKRNVSTLTIIHRYNNNNNKNQQQQQLPQQQQQQQIRGFSSLQNSKLQWQSSVSHSSAMPLEHRRLLSSKEITKNMTLYSATQFQGDVDSKTLELKKPSGNPLVLMMAWLMAKQKHLKKYAQIYTELGFDVMVVQITPWQLLWPTKGTQIVAAETLKFLENNRSYAPIVVHGFSVGAYQFGEVMLQMAQDMERYAQILNRIACQIWDSAADITEIPIGLPKSIFPKNLRMQSALRNYTLYHLKTFHNQATIHYMRSSQMFHSTVCKKPALFFVSKNDLIGPPSSNNAVRENWERADIPVTFKCWDRSVHAAHMIQHRDEYLELLFKHLENNGILAAVGMKSRAKL